MLSKLYRTFFQPTGAIAQATNKYKKRRRKPDQISYQFSNHDRLIAHKTWLKWFLVLTAWAVSAVFTFRFVLSVVGMTVLALIATLVVDGTKLILMDTFKKAHHSSAMRRKLTAAVWLTIFASAGATVSYFWVDLVSYQQDAHLLTQQVGQWELQKQSKEGQIASLQTQLASLMDSREQLSAKNKETGEALNARKARLIELINNNSNAIAGSSASPQRLEVYTKDNAMFNQELDSIDRQLSLDINQPYSLVSNQISNLQTHIGQIQSELDQILKIKPGLSGQGSIANMTSILAISISNTLSGSDAYALHISLILSLIVAVLLESVMAGVGVMLDTDIGAIRKEQQAFIHMIKAVGLRDAQRCGYYFQYPYYDESDTLQFTTDPDYMKYARYQSSSFEEDLTEEPSEMVTTLEPQGDPNSPWSSDIPGELTPFKNISEALRVKPQDDMVHFNAMLLQLDPSQPLRVPIGYQANGHIVFQDLRSMVHMLVAGTTGSGKTQFMKTLVASLIYQTQQLTDNAAHSNFPGIALSIIDPKRVDFACFQHARILHEGHIITCAVEASNLIKQLVNDMNHRYETMTQSAVTCIEDYNASTLETRMPYRIIVIDELADLMDEAESRSLSAKRELVNALMRLAQKSRACGIHLILGTQRPDKNVLDGRLKGNIPTRVCFKVLNALNSSIVVDQPGAERLAGKGDMLFLDACGSIFRLQGILSNTASLNLAPEAPVLSSVAPQLPSDTVFIDTPSPVIRRQTPSSKSARTQQHVRVVSANLTSAAPNRDSLAQNRQSRVLEAIKTIEKSATPEVITTQPDDPRLEYLRYAMLTGHLDDTSVILAQPTVHPAKSVYSA